MKSQVFTTAWEMFKGGIFSTFSEALKAAWQRIKLLFALRSGVVKFAYQKANGERREAKGTLNNEYFQYESKGNGKPKKAHVVAYFDLVANAFRSVRIDRLLTV